MNAKLKKVEAALKARNIQFVRFIWCDNAGVTRAKAVHVRFLEPYLHGTGVGIAAAQQALPVMYDAPAAGSGLTPAGEVHMRADWNTYTPLPYVPGHARVFTDIYDGNHPWGHCPRMFLRTVIANLAKHNLAIQAAFENEFYLVSIKDNSIQPVDRSLFAQTSALDKSGNIIAEITDALTAQGMYPEMLYAESGNGQFEIPIRYRDALVAADQQIAFKETVHAVVGKHEGIIASFVPKLFEDKAGSGAHLHLSIWEGNRNVTADPQNPCTISKKAASFIAGILHHLPALMCFTTPSTNSFKRIRPHFWSGAFTCWGYGNREAAIRIPQPDTGVPITNFELKTVDPSCNPYLALGEVLTAGLDGIVKHMKPDTPVDRDPANIPAGAREKQGIYPLPTTLGQALTYLTKDTVLLRALGPDLARSFVAVRTAEWNAMKDMTLAQEVALLLERY